MQKTFFHIDVNSAFLSWTAAEKLRQGETTDLRTIPSIIGGDAATRHGIVLAKSLPAKKYGIQTAEPIVSAYRKCPNLVSEKPDFTLYRANSLALMQHLAQFCPDIEQVSIDECYMDYTPISHHYPSAAQAAYKIKDSVRDSLGFTVNVGISDCKVLAKMASDFEKPDKVHTLYRNEIQNKMWPLPVSDLYMCGHSSVQVLYKLGIRTIGELATADPSIIISHLKSHGQLLYDYANGLDNSDIVTQPERLKGIGNSTTLKQDAATRQDALPVLMQLAEQVATRLRKDNRLAGMVSVEIKYHDFVSVSHQTILNAPTDNGRDLYQTACDLFDTLWNGSPIRLLGIRTSKLKDPDEPYQLSLFDMEKEEKSEKQKRMDKTIDEIKEKFGPSSIVKASLLNKKDSS